MEFWSSVLSAARKWPQTQDDWQEVTLTFDFDLWPWPWPLTLIPDLELWPWPLTLTLTFDIDLWPWPFKTGPKFFSKNLPKSKIIFGYIFDFNVLGPKLAKLRPFCAFCNAIDGISEGYFFCFRRVLARIPVEIRVRAIHRWNRGRLFYRIPVVKCVRINSSNPWMRPNAAHFASSTAFSWV